jgi:hypothetical protein
MLRSHGGSRCGGQRERAGGKAKVHQRSPANVKGVKVAHSHPTDKRARAAPILAYAANTCRR